MPKPCRVCEVEKPLSEFYKSAVTKDGHLGLCKPCQRRYVQGRYNRRRPVWPEGYKLCPRCKGVLKMEEFGVNAARKDGRQVYCLKCWPAFRRYSESKIERQFLHVEKMGRLHRNEKWKASNRYKMDARSMVYLAIKFGILVRQPCEVCCVTTVEAHHDDYSQPLAVRWLCIPHHNEHHKEERT